MLGEFVAVAYINFIFFLVGCCSKQNAVWWTLYWRICDGWVDGMVCGHNMLALNKRQRWCCSKVVNGMEFMLDQVSNRIWLIVQDTGYRSGWAFAALNILNRVRGHVSDGSALDLILDYGIMAYSYFRWIGSGTDSIYWIWINRPRD